LAEYGSEPDMVAADMVAAKVAALPALKGRISLDSARAALDPHSYLGESVRIAQEGAAMGHALVARIRKGSVSADAP